MVNCAWLNRRAYKEQKTLTLISTRSLLQWGGLTKQGLTEKQAFTISIVGKAREEEKKAFIDFYHAVFKTAVTEENKIVVHTQQELQTMISEATETISSELLEMKKELELARKRTDSLEVGDRVEAIEPIDCLSELVGKRGTIKYIRTSGSSDRVGVEFDKPFKRGHNLHYNGKSYSKQKYGRWGETTSFKKLRKYTRKKKVKIPF